MANVSDPRGSSYKDFFVKNFSKWVFENFRSYFKIKVILKIFLAF